MNSLIHFLLVESNAFSSNLFNFFFGAKHTFQYLSKKNTFQMTDFKETKLVQKKITDMSEAVSVFGKTDHEGNLPLVLIPVRSPTSWWMQIPDNVHVIMHRWGKDIGDTSNSTAGLHILPPWFRVAYLISKQGCVYNCPVTNCPTSDNVMVQVDVVVVFRIQNPRDFVYKLGALKFNALLKAATEESIRGLVRATSHDKVIDLRGSKADVFLEGLNSKFKEFGVGFNDATIKRVSLPPDLEATLEQKTSYDSKQREEIKKHQYNLHVLNDKADLELKKIAAQNERKLQNELAKKERALIEKEQKEIDAQRQKQLAIIKAEEESETRKYTAKSNFENSKIQGERQKEQMILKAKGEFEATKIMVDKYAVTEQTKSKTELVKAKNVAKSLLIEADAEEKAAEQLKMKREYDLAMKKLEVLRKLARTGKVVISGENGDKFIKELTSSIY